MVTPTGKGGQDGRGRMSGGEISPERKRLFMSAWKEGKEYEQAVKSESHREIEVGSERIKKERDEYAEAYRAALRGGVSKDRLSSLKIPRGSKKDFRLPTQRELMRDMEHKARLAGNAASKDNKREFAKSLKSAVRAEKELVERFEMDQGELEKRIREIVGNRESKERQEAEEQKIQERDRRIFERSPEQVEKRRASAVEKQGLAGQAPGMDVPTPRRTPARPAGDQKPKRDFPNLPPEVDPSSPLFDPEAQKRFGEKLVKEADAREKRMSEKLAELPPHQTDKDRIEREKKNEKEYKTRTKRLEDALKTTEGPEARAVLKRGIEENTKRAESAARASEFYKRRIEKNWLARNPVPSGVPEMAIPSPPPVPSAKELEKQGRDIRASAVKSELADLEWDETKARTTIDNIKANIRGTTSIGTRERLRNALSEWEKRLSEIQNKQGRAGDDFARLYGIEPTPTEQLDQLTGDLGNVSAPFSEDTAPQLDDRQLAQIEAARAELEARGEGLDQTKVGKADVKVKGAQELRKRVRAAQNAMGTPQQDAAQQALEEFSDSLSSHFSRREMQQIIADERRKTGTPDTFKGVLEPSALPSLEDRAKQQVGEQGGMTDVDRAQFEANLKDRVEKSRKSREMRERILKEGPPPVELPPAKPKRLTEVTGAPPTPAPSEAKIEAPAPVVQASKSQVPEPTPPPVPVVKASEPDSKDKSGKYIYPGLGGGDDDIQKSLLKAKHKSERERIAREAGGGFKYPGLGGGDADEDTTVGEPTLLSPGQRLLRQKHRDERARILREAGIKEEPVKGSAKRNEQAETKQRHEKWNKAWGAERKPKPQTEAEKFWNTPPKDVSKAPREVVVNEWPKAQEEKPKQEKPKPVESAPGQAKSNALDIDEELTQSESDLKKSMDKYADSLKPTTEKDIQNQVRKYSEGFDEREKEQRAKAEALTKDERRGASALERRIQNVPQKGDDALVESAFDRQEALNKADEINRTRKPAEDELYVASGLHERAKEVTRAMQAKNAEYTKSPIDSTSEASKRKGYTMLAKGVALNIIRMNSALPSVLDANDPSLVSRMSEVQNRYMASIGGLLENPDDERAIREFRVAEGDVKRAINVTRMGGWKPEQLKLAITDYSTAVPVVEPWNVREHYSRGKQRVVWQSNRAQARAAAGRAMWGDRAVAPQSSWWAERISGDYLARTGRARELEIRHILASEKEERYRSRDESDRRAEFENELAQNRIMFSERGRKFSNQLRIEVTRLGREQLGTPRASIFRGGSIEAMDTDERAGLAADRMIAKHLANAPESVKRQYRNLIKARIKAATGGKGEKASLDPNVNLGYMASALRGELDARHKSIEDIQSRLNDVNARINWTPPAVSSGGDTPAQAKARKQVKELLQKFEYIVGPGGKVEAPTGGKLKKLQNDNRRIGSDDEKKKWSKEMDELKDKAKSYTEKAGRIGDEFGIGSSVMGFTSGFKDYRIPTKGPTRRSGASRAQSIADYKARLPALQRERGMLLQQLEEEQAVLQREVKNTNEMAENLRRNPPKGMNLNLPAIPVLEHYVTGKSIDVIIERREKAMKDLGVYAEGTPGRAKVEKRLFKINTNLSALLNAAPKSLDTKIKEWRDLNASATQTRFALDQKINKGVTIKEGLAAKEAWKAADEKLREFKKGAGIALDDRRAEEMNRGMIFAYQRAKQKKRDQALPLNRSNIAVRRRRAEKQFIREALGSAPAVARWNAMDGYISALLRKKHKTDLDYKNLNRLQGEKSEMAGRIDALRKKREYEAQGGRVGELQRKARRDVAKWDALRQKRRLSNEEEAQAQEAQGRVKQIENPRNQSAVSELNFRDARQALGNLGAAPTNGKQKQQAQEPGTQAPAPVRSPATAASALASAANAQTQKPETKAQKPPTTALNFPMLPSGKVDFNAMGHNGEWIGGNWIDYGPTKAKKNDVVEEPAVVPEDSTMLTDEEKKKRMNAEAEMVRRVGRM